MLPMSSFQFVPLYRLRQIPHNDQSTPFMAALGFSLPIHRLLNIDFVKSNL